MNDLFGTGVHVILGLLLHTSTSIHISQAPDILNFSHHKKNTLYMYLLIHQIPFTAFFDLFQNVKSGEMYA